MGIIWVTTFIVKLRWHVSNNETMSQLLRQAMRNQLAEVQTCVPAEILTYDYKKQKASVKPCLNRVYTDGEVTEYPPIHDVPVIFPRSGGASITMPVKKGDPVMIMFSSRSIDEWAENGGTLSPTDNRMHDINDAIAIVGLYPFSQASPAQNNDDLLIQYDGSSVTLKKGGTANVKAKNINAEAAQACTVKATTCTITATKVTIDAPDVKITGNLVVAGDISDKDDALGTFNRIRDIYNGHTHNETNTVTNQPNQLMD